MMRLQKIILQAQRLDIIKKQSLIKVHFVLILINQTYGRCIMWDFFFYSPFGSHCLFLLIVLQP
jgi:hypothetical protein